MTIARDKANSTVTNFVSTGIDDNADANAITINSSENVGIGTSSATRKLDVHSGSDAAPINIRTTQALSLITFDNSSDTSGNHLVGFQGDDFVVGDTSITLRLLSAGGICFGSDTAAANALDDYEEGGYVPSATSGITINNVRQATYTKVGRSVTVGFWINADITSTDFVIAGLPFTIFGRAGGSFSNQNLKETLAVTSITTSIYVYGATTGTDDELLFFLTHDT